eukprot:scaffold44128_cov75-Cyclotella_meneghiniana.AAC.3
MDCHRTAVFLLASNSSSSILGFMIHLVSPSASSPYLTDAFMAGSVFLGPLFSRLSFVTRLPRHGPLGRRTDSSHTDVRSTDLFLASE